MEFLADRATSINLASLNLINLVVVQLYAYTAVRTYCGLYGEGRSAGVATLLVEVSLGRYRTATRLYGYYRLLLVPIASRGFVLGVQKTTHIAQRKYQ